MVLISNEVWNPEIQTNGRHFNKNHLLFRQKCPDFEWLAQ